MTLSMPQRTRDVLAQVRHLETLFCTYTCTFDHPWHHRRESNPLMISQTLTHHPSRFPTQPTLVSPLHTLPPLHTHCIVPHFIYAPSSHSPPHPSYTQTVTRSTRPHPKSLSHLPFTLDPVHVYTTHMSTRALLM